MSNGSLSQFIPTAGWQETPTTLWPTLGDWIYPGDSLLGSQTAILWATPMPGISGRQADEPLTGPMSVTGYAAFRVPCYWTQFTNSFSVDEGTGIFTITLSTPAYVVSGATVLLTAVNAGSGESNFGLYSVGTVTSGTGMATSLTVQGSQPAYQVSAPFTYAAWSLFIGNAHAGALLVQAWGVDPSFLQTMIGIIALSDGSLGSGDSYYFLSTTLVSFSPTANFTWTYTDEVGPTGWTDVVEYEMKTQFGRVSAGGRTVLWEVGGVAPWGDVATEVQTYSYYEFSLSIGSAWLAGTDYAARAALLVDSNISAPVVCSLGGIAYSWNGAKLGNAPPGTGWTEIGPVASGNSGYFAYFPQFDVLDPDPPTGAYYGLIARRTVPDGILGLPFIHGLSPGPMGFAGVGAFNPVLPRREHPVRSEVSSSGAVFAVSDVSLQTKNWTVDDFGVTRPAAGTQGDTVTQLGDDTILIGNAPGWLSQNGFGNFSFGAPVGF